MFNLIDPAARRNNRYGIPKKKNSLCHPQSVSLLLSPFFTFMQNKSKGWRLRARGENQERSEKFRIEEATSVTTPK